MINEIGSKSVKNLNFGKQDDISNGNLSGDENNINKQINTIEKKNYNENGEEEDFEKIKNDNNNSLYEIIYKLKHNTDLNELIKIMNSNLNLGIDSENMKIKLNSFEFDKFHEIKDFSNLEMTIFYSLSDK